MSRCIGYGERLKKKYKECFGTFGWSQDSNEEKDRKEKNKTMCRV